MLGKLQDVISEKDDEYCMDTDTMPNNKEVLRRCGVGRKLLHEMRIKQLKFLGHVVRKDWLESLKSHARTGKIEGRKITKLLLVLVSCYNLEGGLVISLGVQW